MVTTRALGLLLVGSISGCATPPPPGPLPPSTAQAKTLEPAPASPAPSSTASAATPAAATPSPATPSSATPSPATPPPATPPPAPEPQPEPEDEYSFSDFKGASGGCYHAVHCLPPPASGPTVAAAAPHAACEATWHKVKLHPGFSGEQSKKKQRVLCCYRTTVCEQPF